MIFTSFRAWPTRDFTHTGVINFFNDVIRFQAENEETLPFTRLTICLLRLRLLEIPTEFLRGTTMLVKQRFIERSNFARSEWVLINELKNFVSVDRTKKGFLRNVYYIR